MVAATSTDVSGLAAMLSTADGVPTAPAGVAGDFLAALTAALAPSSPAASNPVAPEPAQSSDSTVAAGVSAQASVVVPPATVTPTSTTQVTASAVTVPISRSSLADGAALNVAADPTVPSASTTAAVVAPVVDGNLDGNVDGNVDANVGAVPTSPGTSPSVTVVPAVHPTQRLAAAARLRPLTGRENTAGSAAETSPDTNVSPESADPATPPRPNGRRAAQPDVATGTAVPLVPPTAVPVAVGGAVVGAVVGAVGGAVNTLSAPTAPAVAASTAPAVAAINGAVLQDKNPTERPASDAQPPSSTTAAVATASQQPMAALVAAGPVRGVQKTRTSWSSDSDAAPGSTTAVDRALPGHRADVAATSSTASAAPRVAADTVPAGLGMVGTDRVAKVREQVAGRPMQRLSIELDDARVAIRVRGDKVSVDVTSDPKGALGEGWARQVERTIDRAVRTQESEPRGSSPDRQPGSHGRRQQQSSQRQGQGQQFEIGSWNFEPGVEPHFEERS